MPTSFPGMDSPGFMGSLPRSLGLVQGRQWEEGFSTLCALEHPMKASVWTSVENGMSLGINMATKIFPILGCKTGGGGAASSAFLKEVLK